MGHSKGAFGLGKNNCGDQFFLNNQRNRGGQRLIYTTFRVRTWDEPTEGRAKRPLDPKPRSEIKLNSKNLNYKEVNRYTFYLRAIY